MKEIIYETLQRRLGGSTDVYLEDVVEHQCVHRHIHTLKGSPRKPLSGPNLLMQEIDIAVRATIHGYLFGTFGKDYYPTYHTVEGGVTVRVDGVLSDALVDISFATSERFDADKPPKNAVLIAATKAALLGYSKALLICVDRNTQAWALFNITNFEDSTSRILKDVHYLNALFSGTAIPAPAASELTCMRCPFKDTCEEKRGEDPAPYVVKASVTPAKDATARVTAYLWGLNKVKSGRRTSVIHPSAISTTQCDRAIAYGLLGTEERSSVEPGLRRIFDVGHAVHDCIQRILRRAYPDFKAEVQVADPSLKIYGHCDGVDGKAGVEIKSISTKGFSKLTKTKKEHETQGVIYGTILGLDVVTYIYVNKNSGEVATFAVTPDRDIWHKVATRATTIINAVEADKLPDRIEKDYVCGECQFAWLCRPGETSSTQAERNGRRFGR